MTLTAGTVAVSHGERRREERRWGLAEMLAGLAKANQPGGRVERKRVPVVCDRGTEPAEPLSLKKERNKKNLPDSSLSSPVSLHGPRAQFGASLRLPSPHYWLPLFFFYFSYRQFGPVPPYGKSRQWFLFAHSLTECSLLCWTKWQRKKSADLTTVLRSRIPSFGWESAYLQSHLVLERWLVTSRFFAQISFKVFKLKRMFT